MAARTSMLPHIPNEPFVILRRSVMAFCDYKPVVAALLNYFSSWHSTRYDIALRNYELNQAAISQDQTPKYDTSLWQVHSLNAIREGIVMMASINTTKKAIQELVTMDLLSVQDYQNPRLKFDKRKRYLYKPEKLAKSFGQYDPSQCDLDYLVCYHNVSSLDELITIQGDLRGSYPIDTVVKSYPQATEDNTQAIDFIESSNLTNRSVKIDPSLVKFDQSLVKIDQTIANIQQDTTRIAEAEDAAPAADKSTSFSGIQKSCILAEQHFALMTAEQKTRLAHRLSELGSLADKFTLASWVGAIALELENPESFSQAKSVAHKLNCILQQAKVGHWTPENVATELAQKQAVENTEARKPLEATLRKLMMDKQMWQRVIKNPNPYENDPVYLDSARREVEELNQKIIAVKTKLAPLAIQENTH